MSDNNNLQQAKTGPNDEFYTLYEDINKEISQYDPVVFKDKVVLLPCDTALSEFVWYFWHKLYDFQYKQLIFTGLAQKSVFRLSNSGVMIEKADRTDFFSSTVQDLIKESDIVVTNPPFSIFRDILSVLINSEKQFLILGSQNALSYNSVFKLIKDQKLWLGHNYGSFMFKTIKEAKRAFKQNNDYYTKLGNICWYTNISNKVQQTPLELEEKDISSLRFYDNYHEAVEISRISDIPANYFKPMGVPITFLNRYCPDQFSLIGKSDELALPWDGKQKPGRFYLEGKRLYERIVIQNRCAMPLAITDKSIIESAIARATKFLPIDNLRERSDIVRFDCLVRGYLGEILIHNLLSDFNPGKPEYVSGPDTDLIVNGHTIEIKTSLIPERDKTLYMTLNKEDIKIFFKGEDLRSDAYKDIYIQILFDVQKDQRESSLQQDKMFDTESYYDYVDNTYFVGWITREELIKRYESKEISLWYYGARKFLSCPIVQSFYPDTLRRYLFL